jgi:hypothetical protein
MLSLHQIGAPSRRGWLIGLVFGLVGLAAHSARSATAEFALGGPVGANVAWGTDIDVTVSVSHDVVLAACAYELTVGGTATAVVENRTVAAALARIGTDPDAPLDDNLPLILTPGATLSDVLVSLDTADPPGNPLDGLPPGSDVVVATYRLRLTGGGSLTLTLSAPRAAETQSDPEGSLFSVVTVDPVAFDVQLNVVGGPDLDANGAVDLRDFAVMQACFARAPTGACAAADVDADGDIDATDFEIVRACLTGPGVAPQCGS